MKIKNKKTKKPSRNRFPNIFWHGAKINIEGFNQLRLINEIKSSGVEIFELDKKSSSKMSIVIRHKEIKKTLAILEKLGYNYTIDRDFSPKTLSKLFMQKLALCVAVVVFISLAIYGYGFVWRLEISGYEKIESAYIRNVLTENGFGVGARRNNLDLLAVRTLINSLDEVLETTVEVRGTTLSVTVIETLDYEPFPIENRTGIFSNFDAEVTRVIANSGTPLVDIGSRVFRGETLIAPHRLDSQGLPVLVPSIGRIYGVATFSNSVRFNLTGQSLEPTGQVVKSTQMSIFGLSFGGRRRLNRTMNWEHIERISTENYTFNNWFIPFRTIQTRSYELAWQEKTETLEEKIQYHIDNHIAENAIFVGNSPFTVNHMLEQTAENEYLIHIFLQAELLIGSSG
ncbi:MAG: sporulation protein YqfD [Firmicutes bacterium]|nr:sporulation protein YqfD [Bacillota bacterium]